VAEGEVVTAPARRRLMVDERTHCSHHDFGS
jgi:hypothetical protein